MNIRKYRDIKADIKRINNEIEKIKIGLIPSCVQILTGMPSAHSNESQVERTVEKFEKDIDIKDLERQKQYLQLQLDDMDAEIERLEEEEREFIKVFTEGKSKFALYDKYNSLDYVERKINYTADKINKRLNKKIA